MDTNNEEVVDSTTSLIKSNDEINKVEVNPDQDSTRTKTTEPKEETLEEAFDKLAIPESELRFEHRKMQAYEVRLLCPSKVDPPCKGEVSFIGTKLEVNKFVHACTVCKNGYVLNEVFPKIEYRSM